MYKHKNTVVLVMTTLFINYGLINPTYGKENKKALEVNQINKKNNKTAIEVAVGSFHPGPYAPYQINKKKWNNCNTLNLCNLNTLFGRNIGLTYINRIYDKNNHKVDIDSSITLSSQKNGYNKNFLMFSVIPTYRYNTKHFEERINIGIGAGLNLATKDISSESNDNENVNTQLNLEVAYQINKENRNDIVIGIKHRCSLFGIIGGKLRGSQWYTVGLRHWL